MEKEKNCSQCIWFEDCGCEEVCEFFYNSEVEELMKVQEYQQYLKEQAEVYYEECILEVGG